MPIKPTTKAAPAAPAGLVEAMDHEALAFLASETQALARADREFEQGLRALATLRRRERKLEGSPAPAMKLTVRREVLALAGAGAEELAAFDAEHGEALKAERREWALESQAAAELPARRASLEEHVRDLARQMEARTPVAELLAAQERLFAPAAARMLEAARAFAAAWREMRTAAAVLGEASSIVERSIITGETLATHRFAPIGRRVSEGDLLPLEVATLRTEDLADVNASMADLDPVLVQALRAKLAAAGVEGGTLKLYRAGSPDDPRPLFLEDEPAIARRPEPSGRFVDGIAAAASRPTPVLPYQAASIGAGRR